MNNRKVHRLYQDETLATIPKDGEPWEKLQAWYTENGLDVGTVVDEGSTIVENGKVSVTTIKPIDGYTSRPPLGTPDDLYVYQIPVSPLPKELIS